jgi:hypothetical protein
MHQEGTRAIEATDQDPETIQIIMGSTATTVNSKDTDKKNANTRSKRTSHPLTHKEEHIDLECT